MGKLLEGINGPFSGKVGAVVGYMWRDVPVMRGLPSKRRKAFSEKELNQQARFKLMNHFLVNLKDLLNITYAHLAIRMTGFNKAFSYNVKNSITGFNPELAINYPKVLVSRGDITGLTNTTANSTKPGTLEFSWTDNSGDGKASAMDRLFAAIYDPKNNSWISKMDLAVRADGRFEMDLSPFADLNVHVYLGLMAADGKDAADSVYAGMIKLQPK